MKTQDTALAYQQSTALSASAVGQVVALYDTILRDLHHSIEAVTRGQIEKRVKAVNHALTVIGELQGVLDFDRGGEPAANLNNFYNVTRAMMLKASITASLDDFQQLVSMFTRIRAAWAQAELNLGRSEPTQRLRISSETQIPPPPPVPLPAENAGGSGNGGWRA